MPTKVFLSYSHDSEQHSQRVLALANQLRSHGIDAELDQYVTRPPQGWPRWCDEQLRPESSAFVLMVCTETYLKRIENRVPADEGRGAFWEGNTIYNYIYNGKSNSRFIPILFDRGDEENIPGPLQGSTHYQLTAFDLSDPGYNALYRELTHQPAVEKPPLGQLINLRGVRGVALGIEDDLTVLPSVESREVRTRVVDERPGYDRPEIYSESPVPEPKPSEGSMRDQVFISYSHRDKKLMEELLTHLKPLLRSGSVKAWSDQQIAPGSTWFAEVQSALKETSVAVLLVSPDFLASDFIHEHELGLILKSAKDGGVRVLWVPIQASAYAETPLRHIQAVSSPDTPLGILGKAERNQAWVRVCQEIKKAVNP